jgi:hypothetical protein
MSPTSPLPGFKPRWVFACLVSVTLLAPPTSATEFGLALTTIHYGPYDDPADCPDGVASSTQDVFLRSLDPATRKEFEDRDKRVGSQATYLSTVLAIRRSADGSDLCDNPLAYKDPPMPTGQSKVSYGLDLDGGDLTAHCAHQEFGTADGRSGIDNQIARLTGCIKGVRKEDNRKNQDGDAHIRNGSSVTLIHVANVDDMQNDSDVTVSVFKSKDEFIKDGTGKPLPDATFRPDGTSEFRAQTRGKIVEGVLTTDPVDVRIRDDRGDYYIRGARFQIKIGPEGYSDGILAGYYDNAAFWNSWSKRSNQQRELGFSCPALYEALHKLADGYKDPATGQCTAISAAFNITAVRAFVAPLSP